MQMVHWQPFGSLWNASNGNLWNSLNRFQEEMNRLFDSYGLGEGSWPTFAATFPAVNIWEDDDNVYAEAELPGMELNDPEIYVTGGDQLTLKGERKRPTTDKGVWHRQERGFGSFTRLIQLPAEVEADQVEARFCNGVLTITLPKSETAKPRKIVVKSE